MLSVNCTTKRYVNRNTFWSLTYALITLIPLCNCCDFYAYWKIVFMLIKKIGVNSYLKSCLVYIHTVAITGAGDPNSCSVFRIICDNLNTFVLRMSNSNVVHAHFFFFATETAPLKVLFFLKTEEEFSLIRKLRKSYRNWKLHTFQQMVDRLPTRQTDRHTVSR